VKELIARLIINTASLYAAGQMIKGMTVDTWTIAFIGAIVFSVLNMTVKPILKFISLPVTCLTIGLFSLIINGAILGLTALFTNIQITGFGAAITGAIVVSIINWLLGIIFLGKKED
jgi:putative membrane protein